ncbi:MAG: threonine ammonia-lyase [Candidatus Thorarchaeota archaeon]|jgi:threonine dehydratase
MNFIDLVEKAQKRISNQIKRTPLVYSKPLSELNNAEVFLKLENEQVTGSFKFRGALNKLMTLTKEEADRGVITASTGNHAQGFAQAAKIMGMDAKIVFPTEASSYKLEKIQQYNVEIIQEVGYEEIEPYARKLAEKRGLTYVPPYNDIEIVAGQGTTGLEILEQCEDVDSVVVPIGGGGLIAGISIVCKVKSPRTSIIGAQSKASPEVYESWVAGHWVEAVETDSVAQGLMGGVEADSITLEIIQEMVDRIVLVSEESIIDAIRFLYEQEHLVIEGAGAVSTAALNTTPDDYAGKKVVLVVSGGNISEQDIASLIAPKVIGSWP